MIKAKHIARVLVREYDYDREDAREIAEDVAESANEAMERGNFSEVEEIFIENGIDLDYIVECVL